MARGSHNVIKNSYFNTAFGWAGISMEGAGTSYNKILNNTMIATCDGTRGGPADTLMMWSGASYNLVEGNDFQYATHILINIQSRGTLSTKNIIRNNTLSNPWHSSIALAQGADRNIVEGNTILDSGADHLNNACDTTAGQRGRYMARKDHKSIEVGGASNLIIRRNVLIDNGALTHENYVGVSIDNRTYNNTLYSNVVGVSLEAAGSYSFGGHIFKNNIFAQNIYYDVIAGAGGTLGTNYFRNDDFIGSRSLYKNASGSFLTVESTYSSEWSSNLGKDPQFVDAGNKDLHLKSSSLMVDAGEYLTTVSSAKGSGIAFSVADAGYFTDGYGIISGDLIQVGPTSTNSPVRIVDVNYSTNTITVDSAISWDSGDGVSLQYTGSAPDLGAYEYGTAGSPAVSGSAPVVPSGLSLLKR